MRVNLSQISFFKTAYYHWRVMTYKELSRSNDLEDASWPRENERLICHISRFEDYKFDPLDFDVVGIPLGCVWKFV